MSEKSVSNFRNFIFGVEDSLVSTVGLLSGVASADASKATLFLTGLVLIFVEAFSMAAGSFLSERSAAQLEQREVVSIRRSIVPGVVMFFSYFVSGFVPLAPYLLLPTSQAFVVSIVCSLVALFALGLISGKISKTSLAKGAFSMFFIGGIAIGVGVIVGRLVVQL
jgi:VIT1/CCC1 family predicted Fe2+/Mn2+ transporter